MPFHAFATIFTLGHLLINIRAWLLAASCPSFTPLRHEPPLTILLPSIFRWRDAIFHAAPYARHYAAIVDLPAWLVLAEIGVCHAVCFLATIITPLAQHYFAI